MRDLSATVGAVSSLAVPREPIAVIHATDGGPPTPQASRDIAFRLRDTEPEESGNGLSSGRGSEDTRRVGLDIGRGGGVGHALTLRVDGLLPRDASVCGSELDRGVE